MKLHAQYGFGDQGLAAELEQGDQASSPDDESMPHEFDEVIQLDNQPAANKDTSTNQLISLDADLINSNSMTEEPPRNTPLIAFEENNTIKQDNLKGRLPPDHFALEHHEHYT